MRHLKLILMGTLFFPMNVLAADYGTYRPGSTYLKMPAANPDQCVAYCMGDAQCKGWNFVKLNPVQSICEFNARDVAPISSAISISGNYVSSSRAFSTQSTKPIIQTSGSVTRVGPISPPHVNSQSRRIIQQTHPKPDPRHQIANYRSRIHSIETPKSGSISAPQKPQYPIQQSGAGFTPQLDALPARPASTRPAYTSPGHQQIKRPAYQPMLDTSPVLAASTPTPTPTPQTGISNDIRTPKVRAENLAAIPRLSQMPANKPRPSVSSALAGGPVAATLPPSSSLYGSLYDDVKRPKSLSADDIPQDPDAPIPTVTSVPVENIEMTTF